jgi:crotonobetainyl-CoA:carnitine CoA-transferase CaiB-like acyl-CoA transferase
MQRLGLDYESVAKVNPRIIYCSITGYGQIGPKRDTAGTT